nr:uncharacterized protein LOC111416951 isoform X2 [Onthophagus taurus]
MVILQLDEQPLLIQAVFAGEIETVRKLLESKQDVNYQDFEKRSALHASSYRGDAPMTELLIEHGARVNTKDCRWVTPLHRACCSGSEETVCILLKNQADTGARDRLWQTPLHVASAYNSLECLQHLLERVQNPNVTDRSGRTALHHAVLNGHNDIVELLISKGCIVNACDKKDCRPIHWAAHKGHIETIEILLQNGADINAKDRNLYTPLHVAAASSVGVIQTLLTHGANIEAQNAYGNTALHIACLNGHGACAQELIRHDADRETLNYRGQTPLHIAAASTHGVHCLNMLVGLGVNINRQSCDGRTALHMTAIHGRFTRSKTLIDNGAIVDSIDKNGCTALHIAAQYGHELLSSTLLVYGANPSKKGYEGRTPLHMCCLSGYIECCRIFIKAGVDLNCKDDLGKTPLHCAAYKGAVECVDLLVSSGSDIKSIDNLGRIPLHYASAQGYFFCVFTLVGTGSNPNAQDNEGCTALHLASAYDIDGKCVNYLLEHKADPKLKDFKGFTAVHYAVAGNNINALRFLLVALNSLPLYGADMPPTTPLHIAAKNGNMEILEALMPYFPDPNIRNEDGCTPLLLSARQGYSNCVQMLLRFGAKVSICDSVAGLSPVHHSAKNGYVHCLALLVDNAEDKSIINQPDNLQRTALMLAVSNLHIDCVTTLIKSGADPNVLDKDGHSCLFRAVVTGQHSVLHMLLPRSTVVNTPDSNGKTILHVSAAYGKLACTQRILPYMEPTIAKACDKQNFTSLQWACYTGNFECVAHFFKEGVFDCLEGNPFSAIHCAASAGSEQCIDLLYKQFGPETVKFKDMKCRTPLHVVAIHGHSDCALYLLNLGAEINVKDEDGRTPLMVAAMNGQIEVMVNLIGSKADKTLYDVNGNTALHLACLKKHNHAALLLLDFIDDPNVINMINNERRTPLHISARNGLVNVTRMLIAKGSSVLAVDSTGLTPALSCAPNPSVAQCLAIILASHPIHLQGSNCKDILNEVKTLRTSIRSLTPRPNRGKRRHFQTDITMVNNPDKFELEHMFDIKLDKAETESEFKDWMGNVYVKFDTKEEQCTGGPPPKKKHKTRLYSVDPETEIASYSCHELHGSQSDMSLALKTIYSEEDYRKLIKRSVDNFRKKQNPSQEHLIKFQEKQQRAMCSFKYDFETDMDDNEMVVVSPSRSPKATNKKLKNQKIKIEHDFKDHFERCLICKQFNNDLLESKGVREPEIPIEVMRDSVNKVLAKKGFSNNRCLYAFLNNSFEINSENAYMIFHGMVSPKCEPYIASILNLKNGEVEITDSVDSISEEKLMYWLDNSSSRSAQKKLSSTRIEEIKIKSPTRFKNEKFIPPSSARLEPKSEPSLRSRGAIPKRRDTKKAKNLMKSNSYEDKLRKDEKKSNRKRMIVSTFVDGSKVDDSGDDSLSLSQKSVKAPQIDRELLHKVLTSFHTNPLFINQESNKYFRCYPTYWCVPEIKNKKDEDDNDGETSGRRPAPPRDDTLIYFNERINSNESRSVNDEEENGLELIESIGKVDDDPKLGGNSDDPEISCDLRRRGGVLDIKKGGKTGNVWTRLTKELLTEKIQESEEEDVSTSKKRKLTINLPRIQTPSEGNCEKHENEGSTSHFKEDFETKEVNELDLNLTSSVIEVDSVTNDNLSELFSSSEGVCPQPSSSQTEKVPEIICDEDKTKNQKEKVDFKSKKNKNYSTLYLSGNESKISLESQRDFKKLIKNQDVQKKGFKSKEIGCKDVNKDNKNNKKGIEKLKRTDSGLVEKTSSNLTKKSSKTTPEVNSLTRKTTPIKKLENNSQLPVKKVIQKSDQPKIPEKTRSRSVDVTKTKHSDFIPPQIDSTPILADSDKKIELNVSSSISNPTLTDSENDIGKQIMESKRFSETEDESSLNDSLIVHPSLNSGLIDLTEFGLSDNSGEEDDTVAEIQSIEDDDTKKIEFGEKKKIHSLYKNDFDENEDEFVQNEIQKTKSSKKVIFSDKIMFMDENDHKNKNETDSNTFLIDPEMIELSIKLPDVSFAEDIINQNESYSEPGPSNYNVQHKINRFYDKKESNKKHFLETIPIEKLVCENEPKKNVSTESITDNDQFLISKDSKSDSNVALYSKDDFDGNVGNDSELDNFKSIDEENVSSDDTELDTSKYYSPPEIDLEKKKCCVGDNTKIFESAPSITENQAEDFTPLTPIEELSENDTRSIYEYQDAIENPIPIETESKSEYVKNKSYSCVSGPSNLSSSYTSGSDSMEESLVKNGESEKTLNEEEDIEEINTDQNPTGFNRVMADSEVVFFTVEPTISTIQISDEAAKCIEISEVSSDRTLESILDNGTESKHKLKIVEITNVQEGVQKVFDNINQFNVYRSDFNLSESNFGSETPRHGVITTQVEQKSSTPKSFSIASTSSAGSYVISDSDSTSQNSKTNQKFLSDIEEDADESNNKTSEDTKTNSFSANSKDKDFESIIEDVGDEEEDENKFKTQNSSNQDGDSSNVVNKVDFFVGRSEITPLEINDNTKHVSSEDTNELVEMIDGGYDCNILKKVVSDMTLDDEDTMNIEDNLSEDEVVRENQIEKENGCEKNKTEVIQQDSYGHICPQIKLTQHYVDENHSFSGVDENDESALEDYLSIDDSEANQTNLKMTDSSSSRKSRSKTDEDETTLEEVKRAKSKKSFPSISKIGKKAKKESNCKIS